MYPSLTKSRIKITLPPLWAEILTPLPNPTFLYRSVQSFEFPGKKFWPYRSYIGTKTWPVRACLHQLQHPGRGYCERGPLCPILACLFFLSLTLLLEFNIGTDQLHPVKSDQVWQIQVMITPTHKSGDMKNRGSRGASHLERQSPTAVPLAVGKTSTAAASGYTGAN